MKLMSAGFSMGTVFSSMRNLLRFDARKSADQPTASAETAAKFQRALRRQRKHFHECTHSRGSGWSAIVDQHRLGSFLTEWEPVMNQVIVTESRREPWNKGKLVDQQAPFKLKEIWAIRVRLLSGRTRDFRARACDRRTFPFPAEHTCRRTSPRGSTTAARRGVNFNADAWEFIGLFVMAPPRPAAQKQDHTEPAAMRL
jgi:hypothetical protein